MLTTRQAADRVGITPIGIIKAITSGRLRARKHGPIWAIKEEDLEIWMAQRRRGSTGHHHDAESRQKISAARRRSD